MNKPVESSVRDTITMKSKPLFCLALVLSGILPSFFATQSAYGYVAEVQINHTSLKTDFTFLKIKTIRLNFTNDPVIIFTVVVMPKDKHYIYSGNLKISDTNIGSHDYIVQTSVQARKLTGGLIIDEIPKSLRAKCMVFEFGVAVKYLEMSKFCVQENYDKFGSPTDYCFNLKEFADEK
jgi:hypothetical protein